ncbi:MAG: hypothetical protein MR809_07605 [Rikenellaceae bacterium]|nr:hypothetical protein [Rikenellaceae bacterium]
MKKYVLTLLAAAATFAACTKFVEDPKIEYATIEAPEVTATTASDSSIVVTIAPKEGTTFYSYVVAKGVAKPVDAKALLQGKSGLTPVTIEDKECAEVVEIVPASKASSTATIDQVKSLTIEGLIPYTYYTVYAVATNAQGVISDVATASTRTSDSTVPSYEDHATEEADSVMYYQISFSDPIKLSGEGDLTLHIYGENYYDDTTLNCIEINNVVIAPENISDEGGVITVKIPKDYYIPGALVDLTWPEGFVKNAQDMPCAAFTYTGLHYDAKGALNANGIAAQYEYVGFALSFFETVEEEEEFLEEQEENEEIVPETVYYTDWEALQMVAYARSVAPLASKTKTAKASVSVSDAGGRVVSYPVTPGMTQEGNIAVELGEDPGFGTVATYTIEAGSYVDIFGNENLEYSLDYGTYFCSYGYSINDVVGTYNVTGSEYDFSSGKPIAFEPKTLTIVKSDDSEKGNVMITNYFGIPCIKPVYADFDVDAGKLTIFEWQRFYATLYKGGDTPDDKSDDVVAYFYHSSNNGEDLVLNMYESGVLSNPSDYFGAYLYISKEIQGYNFMLVDVTATKVNESEGPTATPATIPFEFPSNAKRTMKPVIKL